MEILQILGDIFRWPPLPESDLIVGAVYVGRLFLVLIGGLFFLFVLHEFSYLTSVIRRMKRLLKNLRTVVPDHVSTQEECSRLGSAFEAAGARAKHVWGEFSETFVTHRGTSFNTVEAGHFFTADGLRGYLVPLRLIREVPAALTALGILGTFLGLVLGLRGLNIDIGTDEYVRSIDRLIQGIDTAYYTSIWGITGSLVFMGLERFMSGRATQAVQGVIDHLDGIFQRKTEADLLIGILQCQEDLTGVMKSFSTDLSDALRQGFDESIEKHLRPPITEMAQLVTDVTNYASANQAQGVQAIIDSALSGIQNAVTNRAEELAAAMQDTAEQNRAFCETLRQTSGKLDESTLLQIEAVEKYVGATDRLSKIAELIERSEEAMANRSETLESIVGELSEAGSELATVSTQLSVLRDAFESCALRTSENVSQLSHVWETHVEAMGRVNRDLTDGMASYSQQVSTNLRDSLGQFDGHLSSATKSLGVAVKDLQDTLDDLGDQLQRLRGEGEA